MSAVDDDPTTPDNATTRLTSSGDTSPSTSLYGAVTPAAPSSPSAAPAVRASTGEDSAAVAASSAPYWTNASELGDHDGGSDSNGGGGGDGGGSSSSSVLSAGTASHMRAMQARMETAIVCTMLRRKYRDLVLIYIYVALLLGLTPLAVYLFVSSPDLAAAYLEHTKLIHFAIQVVNVVVLYLYIATAFHIGALFAAFNVHPLIGNLVVAAAAGSLLAVQFVDQVSVFFHMAYFDERGFFYPEPPSESPFMAGEQGTTMVAMEEFQVGTSPDSTLFVAMMFVAFVAVLMAVVNALHALYYDLEYRRAFHAPLAGIRVNRGVPYESSEEGDAEDADAQRGALVRVTLA